MGTSKVRYSELRPSEFRTRLQERPLAYLPLGTLEWHGEHLPLGVDSIISESLMIECAMRLGGIVIPPLFFGPDRVMIAENGKPFYGMDFDPHTVPHRQLEGSCYWIERDLFDTLLDATLVQISRCGFKAVFADGHGPSRTAWREKLAEREARFGIALFAAPSGDENSWPSQTDHAATNETSLMLALRPELVDLSSLPSDRAVWPQGVDGEDPKDANAECGKDCIERAISLVDQMFISRGI